MRFCKLAVLTTLVLKARLLGIVAFLLFSLVCTVCVLLFMK